MKRFRSAPRTFSQTFPENFATAGRDPVKKLWRSEPGDPPIQNSGDLPIQNSGDLLAMMVHSGHVAEEEAWERRTEERAAEPPPRNAIISIHGRDVEECELPESHHRRRAA